MSMKHAVKQYFVQMLVEYGNKLEMDGRTWHR